MSKLEGQHTRVMKVKLVLLGTVDVDHLNITTLHTRGRRKFIIQIYVVSHFLHSTCILHTNEFKLGSVIVLTQLLATLLVRDNSPKRRFER